MLEFTREQTLPITNGATDPYGVVIDESIMEDLDRHVMSPINQYVVAVYTARTPTAFEPGRHSVQASVHNLEMVRRHVPERPTSFLEFTRNIVNAAINWSL